MTPDSKPQGLPVNFRDEMMTIIAAVLQAGDITPEQYGEKITPEKVREMNATIMEVFLAIHKKGMKDARTLMTVAKTLGDLQK